MKNNCSVTSGTSATQAADYVFRDKEVLKFAFGSHPQFNSNSGVTQCTAGQILEPQDKDNLLKERACVTLPTSLGEMLKEKNISYGNTQPPPQCPRFRPASGCETPSRPDVCVWSWMSEKCDKQWPGSVQEDACDAAADLVVTCDTWEYIFNTEHPDYNCASRDLCSGPDYDCLAMRGEYHIVPTDYAAWSSADEIWTPISNVLKERFGMPYYNNIYMNLVASGQDITFVLCLKNIPKTLKPLRVLGAVNTLLEDIRDQAGYNPSNGIESITDSGTWEYMTTVTMNERILNAPWPNHYCNQFA